MYEIRDGYCFSSLQLPLEKRDVIRITEDNKTLDEYHDYIVQNNIEKAEIIMPNLKILQMCPNLKFLKIFPSHNATDNFDFSPLYKMPEIKYLHCQNSYNEKEHFSGEIDFSKINGLVYLSIIENEKSLNFNKVEGIKSLSAGGFKGKNKDLTDLFCSKELDCLRLIECGVHSIKGIEQSRKIKVVKLDYNYSLNDISDLASIKNTLRFLTINVCPQIKNFDVLGELENLEILVLEGNNILPDLDFLNNLKNLKLFIFSMNVLNGDLSNCLNIPCVISQKNRKHYNFKNDELPKVQISVEFGIENWRMV